MFDSKQHLYSLKSDVLGRCCTESNLRCPPMGWLQRNKGCETQDRSQAVNVLLPFATENDTGWNMLLPHVNSKKCLWSLPLQGGRLYVGSNRYVKKKKKSLFVTDICSFLCSSWDSLWPCVMHGLQPAKHWQTWVMMWALTSCLTKVTTLHLRRTFKILKTQ